MILPLLPARFEAEQRDRFADVEHLLLNRIRDRRRRIDEAATGAQGERGDDEKQNAELWMEV